jgi:hypothetical protein
VSAPRLRDAPGALALVLAPLALLALLAPHDARAQDTTPPSPVPGAAAPRDTLTILQRFNIDKLRLTALGVSVGAVKPTQVRATESYSLHADYGHIATNWRVIFSATYWGSRYSAKTMRTFEDTLRKVIRDTTGDYELDLGRVDVSDIALATELRWSPARWSRGFFRPYLGGGLGAHVVNAEGRAISGTFVERALDNITAGILGTAGVDAILLKQVNVGMQARYDLLSGARFGSLRLVGTYVFEPERHTPPTRRDPR